MTWPSGDPNQPQYRPPQYPPSAYPPPPPPPMPYQHGQQPWPQPGYPQPPAKKSRRGLIIALVVVAVVAIGGAIALGAAVLLGARDRVLATDLAAGDCLTDIPNDALIASLPTVQCSEPHSGEVFAVLTMPDGVYPGAATIDSWQNKCPPALQSYSPSAMADSSVGVFVLYPTDETWAKGDRAITCIATTDDKRTGSVKG